MGGQFACGDENLGRQLSNYRGFFFKLTLNERLYWHKHGITFNIFLMDRNRRMNLGEARCVLKTVKIWLAVALS